MAQNDSGIRRLYENQNELDKAIIKLDQQFCVLTRLVISTFNTVVKAESVTYEGVNKLFMEFDAFKKRPDYKECFREWFMGEDVVDLPIKPIPKEELTSGPKEEAAKATSSGETNEQAQESSAQVQG